MAITTYSELKTAVANWVARSDLTTRIPEFIAIAEADFAQTLFLNWQLTRDSAFSATARYTSLPSNFRRIRSVTVIGSSYRWQLEQVTPEVLSSYDQAYVGATDPKVFAIVGTEIEILPEPSSSTLELIYWPAISALSDSNTTSTLLTKHPDLYLYRSVLEAAIYMRNVGLTQQVQPMYDRALALARSADDGARYGTQSLTVRAL